MPRKEKIKDILERGTTNVIEKDNLEKELLSGKKLRVKLGIDPTGPKLHIGRAITLWKLKDFQDLGHQVVLIIGDFTAQVGDASDKTSERQPLTKEKIEENMKTYKNQIGKILNLKKVEFVYNSDWHRRLTQQEVLEMAMQFTVAQMIERENFIDRFKANKPIGLHEIMYPLLQGYDSVAVKSDLELGGNDQLFNLLAGRTVQKKYGQKPQDVMTFELLEGTDGRKMSTSYDNCIYIEDKPKEMYGKVMSIKDDLIIRYFILTTDLSMEEIGKIEKELKGGANPKKIKGRLAFAITRRYFGEKEAQKAESEFEKVFAKKKLPSEVPTYETKEGKKIKVVDLLVNAGIFSSKSEVRRLIKQKAVKVNDNIIDDIEKEITPKNGDIIRAGKRKFLKILLK